MRSQRPKAWSELQLACLLRPTKDIDYSTSQPGGMIALRLASLLLGQLGTINALTSSLSELDHSESVKDILASRAGPAGPDKKGRGKKIMTKTKNGPGGIQCTFWHLDALNPEQFTMSKDISININTANT